MIITLIVLALTVVMFVIGRLRSDIVALCALAALILTGVLTPAEALSGFSSPVVIMMVGLFVVGGAVLQTGLARAASQRIMKLSGGSDVRMFLLVVITASIIGSFINNTGTVALMMPIVVSMASQSGMRASRLLMPLAFSGCLGGMLTLIGTPPNLVIQEALIDGGFEPLKFFTFLPVGLICVALGIMVMLPLSKIVLDKDRGKAGKKGGRTKSLDQLVDEYDLKQNLYRYRIEKNSSVCNCTVAELDLRNKYGLSILEIRNETNSRTNLMKNVKQSLAGPDSILQAGDILYLTGEKELLEKYAEKHRLTPLEGDELDFYDIGIAEIVLMPTSKLVGSSLRSSGLRERFSLNVLGVKRGGNYIREELPEMRLQTGDVLLVQGTWGNISEINKEEDDWVVLGEPVEEARKVTLNYKAPMAAFILALMVAMMVFDFIPVEPVTAVIVAGLLMVLTGCLRSVEAAYRTINWESIVLIASMMPMSIALHKTGASDMLSHTLVGALGDMGPTVLLAGVYFTTSLLTMFISNTATAVLMTPIAMSAALQFGVSPYAFLFAVTLGASMSFASPFSTPPNALVMRAGNYEFMDYVKVGLPLQVIVGIVMTFVLPLLFPF